jgi:signal transduction histidine kinase/DNA-binding CsgD family transcriptional regulator
MPNGQKNGEVIDVLLSAVAERDAGGQFIRGNCYILDINAHRTSDDLSRQLSLVEERNRMSRKLHDTVEHSLIGIMLRTDTIKELIDSDPSMARAELESTHALARLGLEQTRRAVWDLEPLAITSKRLQEVISRGLARLNDEGIKTSLTVDEECRHEMDERNKLAIIGIVQEALSNVRLHSRANSVEVRLSYDPSEVVLTIIDDGVGFDLSATHSSTSSASRGIGLANMRESARLAGGSVDVLSTPGSGTQIEVRIPFEHYSNQGGRELTGRPADDEHPGLTNRELEVLKILANGGRNKDIAAEISVSLRTVKFHIENMYRKLDVWTRAELISVATHQRLLTE